MSRRQKKSPRGLEYKATWNCDHRIYPNYTDAAHSWMQFTDCPIKSTNSKYIFIAVNFTSSIPTTRVTKLSLAKKENARLV